MTHKRRRDLVIHLVLIAIAGLTLLPFALVVNNSLRTNAEMDYSFFGMPHSVERMARFTWYQASGQKERIALKLLDETKEGVRAADVVATPMSYGEAMSRLWRQMTRGYSFARQTRGA